MISTFSQKIQSVHSGVQAFMCIKNFRDIGVERCRDALKNRQPPKHNANGCSLNVSLKRQMFLRERLWHESLFWLMLFICLSETLLRNNQSEFHEIWSERNNIKIWCRNGPRTFYAPGLLTCVNVKVSKLEGYSGSMIKEGEVFWELPWDASLGLFTDRNMLSMFHDSHLTL